VAFYNGKAIGGSFLTVTFWLKPAEGTKPLAITRTSRSRSCHRCTDGMSRTESSGLQRRMQSCSQGYSATEGNQGVLSVTPSGLRSATAPASAARQLTQGGLSPFDLAGQDSLSPDKRADENVGIGQSPTLPSKLSDHPVRVRECPNESRCPLNSWRQRCRDEGTICAL
jgi:hypothetical protein